MNALLNRLAQSLGTFLSVMNSEGDELTVVKESDRVVVKQVKTEPTTC